MNQNFNRETKPKPTADNLSARPKNRPRRFVLAVYVFNFLGKWKSICASQDGKEWGGKFKSKKDKKNSNIRA
jgi:hypothetical protein